MSELDSKLRIFQQEFEIGKQLVKPNEINLSNVIYRILATIKDSPSDVVGNGR